jgi:hypothetical protein
MSLDIVRMADMNKTPDIRIRAFIREWATKVKISFVKPVLRQDTVIKLLFAAGFMRGIGDWRPEKGSGNFGTFEVVEPDDPRFLHIIKTGGRKAQLAAMQNPEYYDDDSREMHEWYKEELVRRGFNTEDGEPPPPTKKTKAKTKGKGNGAQAQV